MTIILETQEQLQNTKHEEGVQFRCSQCKAVKPVQTSGGTGYGYNKDKDAICYACCGVNDLEEMMTQGRITLYLTCEPAHHLQRPEGRNRKGKVSNWPGTLSFDCYTTVGYHNIARTRYNVWFWGPDGHRWYGVTYGEYTQICRCKRTKETRPKTL